MKSLFVILLLVVGFNAEARKAGGCQSPNGVECPDGSCIGDGQKCGVDGKPGGGFALNRFAVAKKLEGYNGNVNLGGTALISNSACPSGQAYSSGCKGPTNNSVGGCCAVKDAKGAYTLRE